jgi:beta-glucanase (GH16 family)
MLAAVSLIAACDGGDRPEPLGQVQPIVIPVADTTTRVNFNIDDPTLEIPATFPVRDLDLLTLVWSDEFNGDRLDPEVWFFESGDGSQYGIPGWGNGERQWYLPDNAKLEDGKLKITARRETVGNFGFTSARINTRDRFAFKYGRIEASIKLPSGQGLWPAFWMLAQDSPYGDWPSSGEIDILEAVNLDGFPGPGGAGGGNEIFGTLHFGGGNLGRLIASNTYVPSTDVTEDFRTYALEWDENEIRWYYDGILYAVENSWRSNAAPYPAPFDQPFYILLNLAVGGNFPGSPDGSTPSPATMEVDWVRVYSGEESAPAPAGPGITPDVVISAVDGSAPDLTPTFETFGSGSTFVENFAGDSSYANVVAVTVGAGYGGGALAQLGLTELAPGFATGYGEFVFKVKGLNADNTIIAKLEEPFPGTSVPVQVDLAAPPADVATASLGDGWSQVVIQMSAYGDVSTFSQIVFQTLDGAYAEGHRFYLADIGFNLDDGGPVGAGLGIYSETHTETTVTITSIVSAGNTVRIEDSTAVPPFDGLESLALTYSDDSQGQGFGGAVFEFENENVSAYDTLKFSIDTSAFTGFANLTVQFEPPGGGTPGGNVSLAAYTPVATSGNWRTYEIPLADFTAVDPTLVNKLGFFNARDGAGVLLAGTLYLDDIHLATVGGRGGGGTPGDLAVNGGFEAGDLSGWALFPVSADPNEQTVVTTNPRSGTYAGRLNNTTPGRASIIKQANLTPVAIGQTVTVRFSARGSFDVGGVAFAEFFTELAGEGTSSAQILGGGPLALAADPNVWADFEYTVPITADVSGGITLQLTATTGGDAGSFADVYYDNVSIVIN